MVSIIIPVFNDREYIKKNLESIIQQSYQDIEVICIDDNSTDDSLEEVKRFAKIDARVNYISLRSNQGAFIARKRGVEQAVGDYILFVDADDYLDNGLIEEIIDIEKRNVFDILHFSSDIINCGVSKQRISDMQSFVKPFYGKLYDVDVFQKCFCTEEYGFNIWNKLFKAELCKKVFSVLPDLTIPKANDAFIYYFLSANAHSYGGYKTKNNYHYCFGNGNTGEKNISKVQFDRYCHYNFMIDFMYRFEGLKPDNELKVWALDKLKKRLIRDSLETWLFQVKEEEKTDALKLLFGSWEIIDIVENICDVYRAFVNEFAKYMLKGSILESSHKESQKIAIYYYKYKDGGIEKTISSLIPLYLEYGYNVILITEEEPKEEDYELPDQVTRYVLTTRADVTYGKVRYSERANQLIEILKKENVDTLCYHAASNELLFYDLLITKYMKIKFIVTKHDLFAQYMSCNKDLLSREIEVFPLADALTVLSYEEEVFWKTVGVKTLLIENPKQEIDCLDHTYNAQSNDIVWVGQLNREQKQYQDIIPIMQRVTENIPEAMVRIYGKPSTYKDKYLLEKQIEASGMEENVKYMGFTKDLGRIYGNAGIVLITSASEAFSTVVLESRQFGIPIVTYSMPYLELLKEKKGFREVKQGDIDSAAKEIIEILSNKELRLRLSAEAEESARNYSNQKIMEKWNQLFHGKKIKEKPYFDLENVYGNIIKTIVFHQGLGSRRYRETEKKYIEINNQFKLEQIKKLMKEKNLKLALYPFGVQGMNLCKQFEAAEIEVSLIIDNKWSGKKEGVISIGDLKEYPVEKYLFVISSDNVRFYEEIRKEIYSVVSKENVYDWYPLNGE